ncbi:YutD family protein [Fredinandcohnia sp. QZ13]|uniref:YutD family protein n=1 Tax=Fredinandcohnia sp. QZ13 TaxID=3073144 RepID=UPI0028534583|nr:YutD family protein [Fredinandcohnia sp. QZ13]MDR4889427.1 YutD family protein [Fredinandcohnia sp. QZ13]
MISINNSTYELVDELKDGFNEEAFRARYSDILAKYDYIVGDWGYEQLRLKGFFDDKNQKASFDTKISTLSEYLYEYCNFGCAYFVLKKVKNKVQA